MSPRIRILLTDHYKLVLETLSQLLNSHTKLQVIGTAGNSEEALHLTRYLQPDVVILDVDLEPSPGINLVRPIKALLPKAKVIGLSGTALFAQASIMIKRGASGFVTRNTPVSELITAIIQTHMGGRYICEELRPMMGEMGERKSKTQIASIHNLSQREVQVIDLVRQGQSSRSIAHIIGIAVKTVEVHRYNILKKLGLKNTAELITFVYQNVGGTSLSHTR